MNPAEVAKNPHHLQVKLQRFLPFHDQKTSGIPGLCVLYEGLKMRTTEKLCKAGRITILKSSPCTVVRWDLHTADRIQTKSGERFLQYRNMSDMLRMPCPRLRTSFIPIPVTHANWKDTYNLLSLCISFRDNHASLTQYTASSSLPSFE